MKRLWIGLWIIGLAILALVMATAVVWTQLAPSQIQKQAQIALSDALHAQVHIGEINIDILEGFSLEIKDVIAQSETGQTLLEAPHGSIPSQCSSANQKFVT